ncbi:mechanosensitive ion channel family protein [Prosthecobacter sp.]|jgi:small conductance mechanosensitive channel|uniref:mechanosensitive ion channel family protein n=1 Tax=Prosthecobacter sp. TaxID=1965333 RepID=UPI0031F30D06
MTLSSTQGSKRGVPAGILAVACLTLLLLPSLARAQVTFPKAEEQVAKESLLPLKPVPDNELSNRLRSVLDQIEDFKDVKVEVNAGVVRLSGATMRGSVRQNVEDLVKRFEGVAFVDNQIEEGVAVETRVAPSVARLEELARRAVQLAPVAAVALLIVIGFAGAAHLVGRWEAPLRWLRVKPLLRDLIQRLAASILFVLGLVLALDVLDATAIAGAVLGVAGLAGLAVSFAFRDIVENYLAGMLLSLRQQFSIGDHLRILDQEGKVMRLTAREMVLLTLDGNHLRIPNSSVFKNIICNYTRSPHRRFDFSVGIATTEDIARAQRVGTRALAALKGVIDDPEPQSLVEELGDSNIVLRFFAWVDQDRAEFAKVRSEAIRIVKNALDETGIEMPEPIYRLHVSKMVPNGRPPEKECETAPVAEREAANAEVAVENQLEEQILKELANSADENLLEPESVH